MCNIRIERRSNVACEKLYDLCNVFYEFLIEVLACS